MTILSNGNNSYIAVANGEIVYALDGSDFIFGGGRSGTVLYGGQGSDAMFGYGGYGDMYGGTGNDWLYVNTIDSGVVDLYGGEDDDVIQNAGSGGATMYGGGGADGIFGGSGDDYIYGGEDDDTDTASVTAGGLHKILSVAGLYGGGGDDYIDGGRGDDYLEGGPGDDKLYGGDGDDVLSGGLGRNKMWGGDGSDAFLFDVTPAAGTYADIKGFVHGTDRIWLEDTIFTALGDKVGRKEFYEGKNAHDKNDFLIYKKETKLFYDEDGKGGSGKVLIAKFDKGTHLDHHDFFMV
ncbi:MAG: hypothetical protein KDJ86_14030 [Bauldia sp.]|uniref:hypothetical protein n=1 Tax=Bauldia sp. TaxID=2575872 RepID=UPI001D4E0F19|nr:hypothetical protein [Bauldia sp.]MCB1496902.1 hypothetical protein [Bauldia sp.]